RGGAARSSRPPGSPGAPGPATRADGRVAMASPGPGASGAPTDEHPDDVAVPLPPLGVPPRGTTLVLRGRVLDRPAVMAIVNRTDDSFYAGARQLDDRAALAAVERAAT